jgi:hypothetical protein
MARRLDDSPAVDRVRGVCRQMMQTEQGPGRPDPRPHDDPEKAPETPTDEPKPAPVQDPPAEPNTSPYVVKG